MYVLYQVELVDEEKKSASSLVASNNEIFNNKIIELQEECITIEYGEAVLEIVIKEFFIES